MICLNDLILGILYILLCTLVVVLIILGLKAIKVLDKTDKLLDDVNEKMSAFDKIFNAFNIASSCVSTLGVKCVDFIVDKLKKKGEKEDE